MNITGRVIDRTRRSLIVVRDSYEEARVLLARSKDRLDAGNLRAGYYSLQQAFLILEDSLDIVESALEKIDTKDDIAYETTRLDDIQYIVIETVCDLVGAKPKDVVMSKIFTRDVITARQMSAVIMRERLGMSYGVIAAACGYSNGSGSRNAIVRYYEKSMHEYAGDGRRYCEVQADAERRIVKRIKESGWWKEGIWTDQECCGIPSRLLSQAHVHTAETGQAGEAGGTDRDGRGEGEAQGEEVGDTGVCCQDG